MLGLWRGTVTVPWLSPPAQLSELTFPVPAASGRGSGGREMPQLMGEKEWGIGINFHTRCLENEAFVVEIY